MTIVLFSEVTDFCKNGPIKNRFQGQKIRPNYYKTMKYLSEKISALPKNCLFNKGKVGCGGTTLAIKGDEPYVIAVPFGSLTINKVSQYPNERCDYKLLGVYEGVTPSDITNYLTEAKVPKIITTYDSLPKVIEALGDNVNKINLLVDEYHILFTQYSFRTQAIQNVLKTFRQFKSFTFMTATPLEEDFILEELKGIPIVEQTWADDEKFVVKVNAKKCKDVMASAAKLIKLCLDGSIDGHLYFFVNSVSVIKALVTRMGLTEDNCRAIYSKSNPKKLSIPNSTVEDPPKKINFLTSTVFEGCDVFDPEGRTIILSDPFHKQSLLDISTSIQQIAGRIRDSKYIGEILHLYKSNRYRELSFEDFKADIQRQIEISNRAVEFFNTQPLEIRQYFSPEQNCYTIKTEDNMLVFDTNLPKLDLFNYKVGSIYTSTVTLSAEYRNVDYTTNVSEENVVGFDAYRLTEGAGIDKTFKDVVLELRDAFEHGDSLSKSFLLNDAETVYPFLGKAILKLGFDRIDSLRYVQKDIKNELLLLSDTSNEYKIFCKLGYPPGVFHTRAEIKRDLQAAYDALGYRRAGRASDISKYYNVKPKHKKINGKTVDGFVILNPRFKSRQPFS